MTGFLPGVQFASSISQSRSRLCGDLDLLQISLISGSAPQGGSPPPTSPGAWLAPHLCDRKPHSRAPAPARHPIGWVPEQVFPGAPVGRVARPHGRCPEDVRTGHCTAQPSRRELSPLRIKLKNTHNNSTVTNDIVLLLGAMKAPWNGMALSREVKDSCMSTNSKLLL